MKCSHCGSKIEDKNASFCPSCGVNLEDAPPTSSEKTSLLAVGGTLAIISSCLGAILGILGLISSVSGPKFWDDPALVGKESFVGELGMIAFVPCLVGGILALRRKQYTASMIGIGILFVSSTIATLLFPGLVLSLLSASIAGLTLLAAITITTARGEFPYEIY